MGNSGILLHLLKGHTDPNLGLDRKGKHNGTSGMLICECSQLLRGAKEKLHAN